jgi:tungstate transport system substrate-binding protein
MRVAAIVGVILACGATAFAAEGSRATLLLASTTSAENSGLLAHLLPRFEAASGIRVRVVAVGTGQALKLGERGDADLLLLHDPPAEEAFLARGFGLERREVMANDFVLVGPRADPAGIRGGRDAAAALAAIAARKAPFLSRGDESGTHALERALWRRAGIDPTRAGSWYRETGSGMGATLNTAAGLAAYTLADRASWAAFRNRRDLEILLEGDPLLENVYSLVLVSPIRHPHVRIAEARAFADWLGGPEGQAAIAAFAIDGRPLFRPTARPPGGS